MNTKFLWLATLATFLSVVNCDSEETFDVSGGWKSVKVYPNLPDDIVGPYCSPQRLKLINGHCQCGEHTRVQVYQLTLGRQGTLKVKIPVLVLNAEEEENIIEEALTNKCSCKNKNVNTDFIFVVRYLNENYILGNTRYLGSNVTVLFTKDMPSEDELKNFEQTSNVLKDKEGQIVCMNEVKPENGDASKKFMGSEDNTSANWLNYAETKN